MIADLVLPTALRAAATDVVLRRAVEADLTSVVALLADDPVSAARGDVAAAGDLEAHRSALVEIVGDPANELLVVEDGSGAVVATMQLTRIPGMARRGAARLQVEAVRVAGTRRSSGIGAAMMRWVAGTAAPALGATLVQLTSDEARRDAHRFYERLGFIGSHRGFKLPVA